MITLELLGNISGEEVLQMLDKFSALIGVKQDSIVEPDAPAGCALYYDCGYPYEATFYWYNSEAVFQFCGC